MVADQPCFGNFNRLSSGQVIATCVTMPRMKAAVNLLWILLSLLGSLALARVVGVVNPNEKVNGLWLVVAAGCINVLAYGFYGRWLVNQRRSYRLTWLTAPFGAVARV